MKKFIYSSLILGSAFALASCSADEPGAAKGDGNVSLTVQLPADVATRFGDASTINKLYYSICTVGTETTAAKVLDSGDQEWPLGQTSTTVDLRLVPGQEYQVVFFACNTAATGYKYTASNATLEVTYGADMINNDAYDAFSAVKGEISTNTAAEGKTITLTRPFAQLNIGTNDFKKGVVTEYLNGKNDNDEDNSYSSTLSIGGLATDVNFLSNTYTGSEEVTFNLSGIKEAIGGYPVENYSYLEMNYLLVDPATADASGANLVDATYAINADGLPVNSLDLTNLPLRANYQTNVYGSLLTQKASFTVEIAPGFATPAFNYFNDAVVKMVEGKVVCVKPILPAGVTEADLEGQGGVYIDAEGNPQTFPATTTALGDAIKKAPEVYLTPNATIESGAYHILAIPRTGVKVYGNGATMNGGKDNIDFVIQETEGNLIYPVRYENGDIVNIYIENLNQARVWGIPVTQATFNISMKNCTLNGRNRADSTDLMNCRVSKEGIIINVDLNNCYFNNLLEGFHETAPGVVNVNNCTFENVGIGINLAKKLAGASLVVNVDNCKFIACGIAPDDTSNSAWNYAAPIRVVDNGGPADATVLTINNCSVTGTISEWDVLLMDYREGKTWFPVKYTITNSGDLTVRAAE